MTVWPTNGNSPFGHSPEVVSVICIHEDDVLNPILCTLGAADTCCGGHKSLTAKLDEGNVESA